MHLTGNYDFFNNLLIVQSEIQSVISKVGSEGFPHFSLIFSPNHLLGSSLSSLAPGQKEGVREQ